MALGGAVLRIGSFAIRALQFACAAIILGIYSYFLAVLANHNVHIPTWEKAVEGLSGAACLYTLFAVLLTLFLGAKRIFALIAIALDVCFFGSFIAIAILTRHGASSCHGIVDTPLGTAPSNESAPGAGHYSYVCSLNTACFALAIISLILFLISAPLQFLMMRHHQREQVPKTTKF